MTTPADPEHIAEVVDALRERLGGEEPDGSSGGDGGARVREFPRPDGNGPAASDEDGERRDAWATVRQALRRRDIQLLAGAAVLAAAAAAALLRSRD